MSRETPKDSATEPGETWAWTAAPSSTTVEQTIVVTGATDGLGRYISGELAQAGALVVVHGRNPAKVARTRDELAAAAGAGRVDSVLADLSDLGQVDRLADELLDRLDRLDVLV